MLFFKKRFYLYCNINSKLFKNELQQKEFYEEKRMNLLKDIKEGLNKW